MSEKPRISEFVILGERCSGTNFLEALMLNNFEIKINRSFSKHFFGFENYENYEKILFIGIIRHPYTWINSLAKYPYHVHPSLRNNLEKFLTVEFTSGGDGKEFENSRNIYTGERYKNIFELRKIKLKFLMEDMPKRAINYILIKYEDLRDNFEETLDKLKNQFTLVTKPKYPIKIEQYKGRGKIKNEKFKIDTNYLFSKEEILKNINFDKTLEMKLNYYVLD